MPYMEDRLDMPVRDVLPIMQERIMTQTTYFGIQTLKSPLDFWVYQETIFALKPDFIVEIGNFCGGSALALAHICDSIGKGQVIGLDLRHELISPIVRSHPRTTFIEGDACQSFTAVRNLIPFEASVLIIEDSAHTFDNTLNVLHTFSPLVQPGSYFIVEDSICHHGLEVGPNPGPYEAIEAFLAENQDFELDRSKESFFITWNPKGYLKRKQAQAKG